VALDQVGGYKEDPLRKKSLLLAMGLNDRPETFLPLRDDEQIAPIMDYHNMRSCLRIGLIDVVDGELDAKLTNRQIVSPVEEWAVRYPAYLAYEQLVTLSGRSPMSALSLGSSLCPSQRAVSTRLADKFLLSKELIGCRPTTACTRTGYLSRFQHLHALFGGCCGGGSCPHPPTSR
jgi:hypothetical protein